MNEPTKCIDCESRWRTALDSISTVAEERRQWEHKYWDLQLKLVHLYDRGPRGWWERFLFIFCLGRYHNRRGKGHYIP